MRERIKSVLATHTVQNSLVTIVSTFLTAGLGAIYYLVLARILGSHDYGLFILGMTILLMVSMIVDVGSSQGLVRFSGLNRDSLDYFPYAKIALKTKLIAGVITLVAFATLASPISQIIFRKPDLIPIMSMVGLGVLTQLLLSFSVSLSQGLQKFYLWGGLQVGSNVVRLVLVFGWLLLFGLTPNSGLGTFVIASFVGFVVSWVWIDRRIIYSQITKDHLHKFWSFNGWVSAFMILTAIVSRLDSLISARYLSLQEIGVYGLSNIMVSFMPQLTSAIGAVTASKFAGIKDKHHESKYLGKAILLTCSISILVGLMMIPVAWVVIIFTGQDYIAAFAPFLILLVGTIVFSSTNPIRDSLLYFHNQPRFFVWLTLIQGAIITILGYILIPKYGIIGASVTMLISHLCTSLLSLWYYQKYK